ncbi:MAG: hypothetical protein ACK5MA_04330, partial [Parachlamydiaceae bacterium]
RYRKRAGNILVRLGFYTPKAKRETVRCAEGLIQKAEAIKSLIQLSERLKNPIFDRAATSDEIKEQIRHFQGKDALSLSTLLSLSKEGQPFEGIRELIEEEARGQFKNLVENAISPREWERWVSSFSNGSWKRIKKTSDRFTYWENCHLLARAALMYLPSMHEEPGYFIDNADEINRLFRRGLRITYNNGHYERATNFTEELKFENEGLSLKTGPVINQDNCASLFQKFFIKPESLIVLIGDAFHESIPAATVLNALNTLHQLERLSEEQIRLINDRFVDPMRTTIRMYREGSDFVKTAMTALLPRITFYIRNYKPEFRETAALIPAQLIPAFT